MGENSGMQVPLWVFLPNGDTALYSFGRSKKPSGLKDSPSNCIFCPENYDNLGDSVFEGTGAKDQLADLGIHVIPNLFPSVMDADITPQNLEAQLRDMGLEGQNFEPARGQHWVMIESCNHDLNPLAESTETEAYYKALVEGSFVTFSKLGEDKHNWSGSGRNYNGKNFDAGMSQPHPHRQFFGVDRVPSSILERLIAKSEFEKRFDGAKLADCPTCEELIKLTDAQIIEENEFFVSYFPWVGKDQKYEIRVVPKIHLSHFDSLSKQQKGALAEVWYKTMVRLGNQNPDTGFNDVLRQAPNKLSDELDLDIRAYHLKQRIYPVDSLNGENPDGFARYAFGSHVYKVSPLEFARRLKK